MIESIPRISVYIISYNQEHVIRRTLDSIISQIDYVYEVCVSDDHSTDKTWEILNEYSKRYPGLFKLHRNELNLGIFENTEKVWTMPTGDIVYDLAGDDECGEGWFKQVVEFIQSNNIDYKNELFCIYGDYKAVYPNGDRFVFSNSLVSKYPKSTLSLSIRGAICSRSTCYSINILRKFQNVSQGLSYKVETAQDRQLQMHTEKVYYIPYVGNVYFARIGVSVNMSKTNREGRLDIDKYAYEFIQASNKLNKKDGYYLLFRDALTHYNNHKTLKGLYKVWLYQNKSLIVKFDLNYASFQRIIFAIRRRLPHKSPLIKRIG